MRSRIEKYLKEDAYRVNIHTFHNLCTSIISNYPEYFYDGAIVHPADDVTKINILETILKDLSHDSKIKSYHPEQGFLFLSAIQNTISHLKKAGLTPDDLSVILDENDKDIIILNEKLSPIMSERVSDSTYDKFCTEFEKLYKEKGNRYVLNYHSLIDALYLNFKTTVLEKKDFSDWKSKNTEKNTKSENIFKDTRRSDTLREINTVYKKYQAELYKQGYQDFDDMILDVLTVLKKNESLRLKIQEQYQYVLVDEFQDTNDAQMQIIYSLTHNDFNENKPNIMAVGDDDQAIYKFQGAELSNILEFTKMYSDVKVISLTQNYRSNSEIVDASLSMIRNSEFRLEKLLAGFVKELKSDHKFADRNVLKNKNAIEIKEFDTKLHEYSYVADKIKEIVDKGVDAEKIAIISRNHRDLTAIIPYLSSRGIPLRYEKDQHVLKQTHIKQLIDILHFANNTMHEDKDFLLSKILSFPFWNIKQIDLWTLSRRAYTERKDWMSTESESQEINNAKEKLGEIIALASYENAEHVIDFILNKTGFRDYYFNSEKFTHEKSEYLVFLSNLRAFIQAIRDYKQGKEINVSHVIDFVTVYENNTNLNLSDKSPFVNARNAVNLLTAHKSKGLEFEIVFILSGNESTWANKKANATYLPKNLPITPAGDSEDDWLRLFFVTLTRAKDHIYITNHRADDKGKGTDRLRFLGMMNSVEVEEGTVDHINSTDILESSVLLANQNIRTDFLDSEKALLDSILENLVLPITHVNNFLNIPKGGPMYFLENNVLRFPQAKTPNAGYGSAMHNILNKSLMHFKTQKKYPSLDEVKKWFTESLMHERLSRADYKNFLAKGLSALDLIYKEKILTMKDTDVSEVDFKNEGVTLQGEDGLIPLTGKIDVLHFKDKSDVYVADYKTGKSFTDWVKGNNENEKIKLHFYRNQLVFYKILIKKSKNLNHLNVLGGVLEFIEGDNELRDLYLDITDDDMDRLEGIIKGVYKRIMEHDFTVPEELVGLGELESIERFEEMMLQ
jgi:DNA helicase-2/ATP-dependent DNA helicase PcrA